MADTIFITDLTRVEHAVRAFGDSRRSSDDNYTSKGGEVLHTHARATKSSKHSTYHLPSAEIKENVQ